MAYRSRSRRGLGASQTQDATTYCGWDCTGFWSNLDPCCLLLAPGDLAVMGIQTAGGLISPPAVSTTPPAPFQPPGPPSASNPSQPTFPSQDQQVGATLANVIGTPADPDSPIMCRYLGIGCSNNNSGSVIPAWLFWVALGFGFLLVEGRH